MAQIGWIYDSDYWSHEDMMAYAGTYPEGFPYTPEMVDLMFRHSERNFMSPTTFQGCPRAAVLRRETGYIPEIEYQHNGYYVRLNKAWAAARGTIAHLLFENGHNEDDAIIEERFSVELEINPGEWAVISGKPDKLVPEGDGTYLIIDYKTTEDAKVEKLYHSPKTGWIAQLSSYKYILHHNGMEVSRARLQMVSMERPMDINLTDKLWDYAKTEKYLRWAARKWKPVYDNVYSLRDLPPPLDFTLDDNSWLCMEFEDKKTGEKSSWCEVRDLCFALRAAGK